MQVLSVAYTRQGTISVSWLKNSLKIMSPSAVATSNLACLNSCLYVSRVSWNNWDITAALEILSVYSMHVDTMYNVYTTQCIHCTLEQYTLINVHVGLYPYRAAQHHYEHSLLLSRDQLHFKTENWGSSSARSRDRNFSQVRRSAARSNWLEITWVLLIVPRQRQLTRSVPLCSEDYNNH